MLSALRIIVQNGSFILFLFLQSLSLYWLINFNQNQNKIYHYSFQRIANNIQSKYSEILEYISLKKKNENIAAEYAKLLDKQYHYYSKPNNHELTLTDSSNFHFIPARVINNSISKKNNIITVNRGGRDGVMPEMGVITTAGVVGIVRDTSAHFATILSLLNSNCKISAKLKRCGFFGPLSWNSNDPGKCNLMDIQKYADVRLGDTVVTSGYSYIFPEGIPIGTVEIYRLNPGAFVYDIEVKLFQSLANIESVFLINDEHYGERKLLELKAGDDE